MLHVCQILSRDKVLATLMLMMFICCVHTRSADNALAQLTLKMLADFIQACDANHIGSADAPDACVRFCKTATQTTDWLS